jgi:hypothetical protein
MTNALAKIAGVTVLGLLIGSSISHADNQSNLDRIIVALSHAAEEKNIDVTAHETDVVFTALSPLSRLLSSNQKLCKQLGIGETYQGSLGHSVIVTNIRTFVYKFRGDGVLVLAQGLDPQTHLSEQRTLLTSSLVFTSRTFTGNGDTNITYQGDIYPRSRNSPVDFPVFLSTTTLGEWVRSATSASCSVGLSSRGTNCYIVRLPPPVQSPLNCYELLLQLNDLRPVEMRSYLADGKPYSITTLELYKDNRSGFCRRADTRVFCGEQVFKESVWETVEIKANQSPLIDDIDSFFTVGTFVSDRRFAKPIEYTSGIRLPNQAEIAAMLKEPRGVAMYQRATHSEADRMRYAAAHATKRVASNRYKLVIRLVIASAVLTAPIIWVCIILGKRRSQAAT